MASRGTKRCTALLHQLLQHWPSNSNCNIGPNSVSTMGLYLSHRTVQQACAGRNNSIPFDRQYDGCSEQLFGFPHARPFSMLRGRGKSKNNEKIFKRLPLKNGQITCKILRVVFPENEGQETKVMPLEEAQREAASRNLDLVMASETVDPPVARLVSWEKLVYTIRQKEKAQMRSARENKKLAAPKEIRITSNIAPHDMNVKIAAARKILQEHHILKLSVLFKGMKEVESSKKVLEQVLQDIEDVGKVKDTKHLVKPQFNRWIVPIEPIVMKE